MPKSMRIAMWSGPRNLSTALMRSFSSRPDTAVIDEPFYAFYLKETGIGHPGRDEIIAAYPTDWEKVLAAITGPIPGGKAIWYQKQMAHHMLSSGDAQRLVDSEALTHAFLIRDPAEVISSYTKVHAEMTLAETGLPYQMDLFERVRKATGEIPPVIDARDALENPERTLRRLCEALGIDFNVDMLHWPAGPHPDDGIWAPHWYAAVYRSTGFGAYKPKGGTISKSLQPMLKEATAIYEELAGHRL